MAMKFPQYLSNTERTITVVGMIDYDPIIKDIDKSIEEGKSNEELTDEELKELEQVKDNLTKQKVHYRDNKGYVDENEKIWIFSAKGKPKNFNAYPYFWLNEDGEKEFSDPPELIKKAYSVENMVDMSLLEIIDETLPNEQHYNEEMLNDINAAASFFVPTLREEDDFLKKIVKQTIIRKGVDINGLKSMTSEKYILPNMKSALQNKTKMSVIYFYTWMNLLGCDFELTVIDNGEDGKVKLKYPLVYRSYSDKVGIIKDGEIEELPSSSVTAVDGEVENE